MNKETISIIGTVGVPAKYGGFETLVDNILSFLTEKLDVTVYCSSKKYKNRITQYKGAKLVYINWEANGISSIFYDMVSILKAVRHSEKILLLGVSGSLFVPIFRNKVAFITNIDGIEWKREKWNKPTKLLLRFLEKIAVKYSQEIISDNESIRDYIYQKYNKKSTLITYGGDHSKSIVLSEQDRIKWNISNQSYFFTVCRIEPENNIHMILDAFKKNGLNYVIVGNWNNSLYGKELFEKYNQIPNLQLFDPIYDIEEINKLRSNCHCYVHGHKAGGTNPSLVEAMFLGLNIIAYNIDYNRNTTDNKAIYFSNSDEISLYIKNEKYKNGKAMQKIAEKKYKWEIIAKDYIDLIQSF